MLQVANDYPFPPNHGGRVDVWRRLQALSAIGRKVDLLATLKEPADAKCRDEVLRHCRTLFLSNRQLGWQSLRPLVPYQLSSRRSLSRIPLPHRYETVLLESEQTAEVLSNPAVKGAKVLLRVHNDESAFLLQLGAADTNWARKVFYRREANLFRRYSPQLFNKVDRLLFSSRKQYGQWVERNPVHAHKAVWIPPSASPRYEHLKIRQGATVLFVGGLSSVSNQEGIRWYLEHVHPALVGIPNYEFRIVGRTRQEGLPGPLRQLLRGPSVSVITDAPEIEPHYADSAVFINPMQSGASIKVKTVNAVEYAVPTVSTEVGNEGTGFAHGEQLYVANSPEVFTGYIKHLLANPAGGYALASRGLAFIERFYDHERLLGAVLSTL